MGRLRDRHDADIFRTPMRSDTPQPPAQAIVIFDGACLLCDRVVRFITARDPTRRFRFVSLQSPEAGPWLASLGIDPKATNSIVLVAEGVAPTKSEAILWILGQLASPWRWLRLFRLVPRPVRDRVYEIIARNRHRWLGTKTVCPASAHDARDGYPR